MWKNRIQNLSQYWKIEQIFTNFCVSFWVHNSKGEHAQIRTPQCSNDSKRNLNNEESKKVGEHRIGVMWVLRFLKSFDIQMIGHSVLKLWYLKKYGYINKFDCGINAHPREYQIRDMDNCIKSPL